MSTSIADALPQETIYQLPRFRWDNTPYAMRNNLVEPNEAAPTEVTDDELCSLLVFAARNYHGDLSNPRQLEAFRVISLVPEELGAKLFATSVQPPA